MSGKRSYGDSCGIARALDLVGERWALLVVRELMLGPKRFTDLRSGLSTASPNVLSQRLDDLEDAGVVRRRKLEPPAAVWIYELTEWGRELEPVLLTLGRWGSASPSMPAAGLSVDSLMLALKTMFDSPAGSGGAGITGVYGMRLGDERFRVGVADGGVDVVRGAADDAVAGIETDTLTLTRLVFGGLPLADAVRSGDAVVTGDRRAFTRFLRLFPLG